jgi:hypothetical protein
VGSEENLLLVFLAFHGPAFSTVRQRFGFWKNKDRRRIELELRNLVS